MKEELPVELPLTLREIVALIGLEDAMKLVEWRGGVGFHTPHDVTGEHELVKTVGLKSAKALTKHYGGEWVWLPRCQALLLAERNRRIRAARTTGKGARKLALEFKLTDRQVWNILGNHDQDDAQGSLFPTTNKPRR